MSASLAYQITRAASTQSFYTIRFLVDRPRVDDAFRAYAYFRWVDDLLDAGSRPHGHDEMRARRRFVARQRFLVDQLVAGERPDPANEHEAMLVDLLSGPSTDDGLRTYVIDMMRLMEFDVGRRGHLVTGEQLDGYTRLLATSVTESMHHFIGNGSTPPDDPDRYMAAAGAHVLHMLRDTADDLRAGYVNVPREWLEANAIGPWDVQSEPYRRWVEHRVRLAQTLLEGGRRYYGRVGSRRLRIAGLAYIARFEWLVHTIERDGYRLRPTYGHGLRFGTAWRMSRTLLPSLVGAGPTTPAPAH
jgi:phytoene/squalene synthetase